ncbi:MAG: cellulase family glycosylhydrolase [Candidatus Methanofastidiosia archaeon]|jgi:hypothetical protein
MNMNKFKSCVAVIVILIVLVAACIQQAPETTYETPPETNPEPTASPEPEPSEPPAETQPPETTPPEPKPETPEPAPEPFDKMTLWDMSTGPHLRGANLWQRRVYPELDGPTFMGSDPVGPPSTQEDFNRLAALGCNYVNISHPGLFTETPPYTLDKDIQNNLDRLLTMIAKSDMFAVISFRTGPGRSEFTFVSEDVGDWFDESYLNDSVWQSQEAQDAWVTMWEYTAQRYKDNPIVAGYDLMVEPNSNETGSHYLYDYLDMWDPEEFYNQYGGTLYDWNQLYPEIIDAIRTVDKDTPILVGGNGYSSLEWLPYLQVVKDKKVVYIAHQYWPGQYTYQFPTSIKCSYPGKCDINRDGSKEQLDKAWLTDFLSLIDDFTSRHNVSVGINEFGAVRWVPGAAQFMDDQMAIFEEKGVNNALWEWQVWEPFTEKVSYFNFLLGPDPDNTTEVPNELKDVITKYWSYNNVRPSTVHNPKIHISSEPVSFTNSEIPPMHYWLYTSVNQRTPLVEFRFFLTLFHVFLFYSFMLASSSTI